MFISKILAGLLAPAIMLAAPSAAQAQAHRVGTGPFTIKEENGSQYVGAFSLAAGTMVTTVPATSARSLTFNQTTTYHGDQAGLWEFSNGFYMAANTTCTGVTIKSSSASSGTLWAVHITGGHLYLVNDYCDTNENTDGLDTQDLGAANTAGHQWGVADPDAVSGFFAKITLGSP